MPRMQDRETYSPEDMRDALMFLEKLQKLNNPQKFTCEKCGRQITTFTAKKDVQITTCLRCDIKASSEKR